MVGNFGSVDRVTPTHQRYTEVRMAAVTLRMFAVRGPVILFPNYDGQQMEPSMCQRVSQSLLVNGAAGIAMGMATSIPSTQPTRNH